MIAVFQYLSFPVYLVEKHICEIQGVVLASGRNKEVDKAVALRNFVMWKARLCRAEHAPSGRECMS